MENGFNPELSFEPDKVANVERYGLLMLCVAASLFGRAASLDTENLPEDIRALLHKYTEDQKEDDK